MFANVKAPNGWDSVRSLSNPQLIEELMAATSPRPVRDTLRTEPQLIPEISETQFNAYRRTLRTN